MSSRSVSDSSDISCSKSQVSPEGAVLIQAILGTRWRRSILPERLTTLVKFVSYCTWNYGPSGYTFVKGIKLQLLDTLWQRPRCWRFVVFPDNYVERRPAHPSHGCSSNTRLTKCYGCAAYLLSLTKVKDISNNSASIFTELLF